MIIEYIRYKVTAEQRTAFIQSYTAASGQLDASPFCQSYEISECAEEPGLFVVRITWTSAEDHMNGFRKSSLFPGFFAHVKPFYTNILEMRHYNLMGITNTKAM